KLTEGNETVRLSLSNPTGGVGLGSQSNAVLTIVDDDILPSDYRLTIAPPLGGTVTPPSGLYPTNSVQIVTAIPEPNYEFVRWEGSLVSFDDPLLITMTQDYTLAARFRVMRAIETFESGALKTLPWTVAGDAGWFVQSSTAAGGRFAARSGLIG